MTAGTNPVAPWALPIWTGGGAQDSSTYKDNIDACIDVAQRVADAFAPHQSATPGMSVLVDAGFLVQVGPSGLQNITEVVQQTATITTAPTSPNKRIDLVVIDAGTGTVSVIAGTPASSPSAPALTVGKKQIAQVYVGTGVTSILNASITDLRAVWAHAVPGIAWAVAGGSSDVITAAYTPANAALVDGLILGFRATAANATTTPSFNADGLGAKTITKKGGAALLAGDIPGALAECLVRYNLANTRWELLNPAAAVLGMLPTREVLTSGSSATYTTPNNVRQLRVRMIGGGASGSNNTTGGTGGNDSSFAGIVAKGGSGSSGSTGAGGAGGAGGSGGSLPNTWRTAGSAGSPGESNTHTYGGSGGNGGAGIDGAGAGSGGTASTAPSSAASNSGAGGGGEGAGVAASTGGGGGAGEYVEIIINSPSATYTYNIGTGGVLVSAGSGGSGVIIVDEIY